MAKIQKLVEIGKTRTGCTGTTLTCTGTSWPKMTRMQNVPVQVDANSLRKVPRMCVFPTFDANSLHTTSIIHSTSKTNLEII